MNKLLFYCYSAMGYEVYMDGNADTEGNYSLVALRCKNQLNSHDCDGNTFFFIVC
jgi:hypothetical protein